ncbi:MAG: class I SAM-dependent methyltransferase [Sandaracinus sp.]|nr:class I SAM-dependent methyltransferase [Sandaracinus sp.]
MAEADRDKWDARYRAGDYPQGDPSWLKHFDEELPTQGRGLDVASGPGRLSIWMARRGLEVLAIDISPVGLALAREAAADEGVKIATRAMDLEREPLPEGSYAMIACFHYRQRSLFPVLVAHLAPGGVIVAELATTKNAERNEKPSKKWLCAPNELIRDSRDLEVLYYREAWVGDRHLARLVARRSEE